MNFPRGVNSIRPCANKISAGQEQALSSKFTTGQQCSRKPEYDEVMKAFRPQVRIALLTMTVEQVDSDEAISLEFHSGRSWWERPSDWASSFTALPAQPDPKLGYE
jgi:hypothetical protein